MEGDYNTVYSFSIYLVLDLNRDTENISLFYIFTGVINEKKRENVFWLFLSILAGISIPSF